MNGLEALKKKLSDIEMQSLAWEGCGSTFTVREIMDLIDSVELAQNLHNGGKVERMTREKAIEILSSYKNSYFGDALHGGVISVSEIIDLLSAQTDNDWIPVTRKAYPDKEGGVCGRK